jgi:O-antigen/teichoic acid export membrane protein
MTSVPVSASATVSEVRAAAAPPQTQRAPLSVATDFLRPSKLRIWGQKSIYSVTDQGLTSLTGFSVSFLLARWLVPELYGAYAIAFAAYLVVCGFHNAIVLEPMSVFGGASHAGDLRSYFRAQTLVHAVIVTALSVIAATVSGITWLLAPHSPLVGAIFGSAVAVPFLLLLWLARRMCYVLQRPRIAALGSAMCLTLVLFGLYTLRYLNHVTPFAAFMLVAGASLLGAFAILFQIANLLPGSGTLHGVSTTPSASITWRATLRENWSYGRWLFGTAILYPISGQVQMFFVAAFLGLGSAGVLRAMMIPAAVMTQSVSAIDLLILPGFSRDFSHGRIAHMRQKALLISCALGGAGLCFAVLLRFVAAPAEHLLFGGKFAAYIWLMPLLALVPAINGFNSGFSATLRGSQKPYFDLLGNALAAPVAALSAFLFIRWWGLAGAAISLVAGCGTLALANLFFYWHLGRSKRASESRSQFMYPSPQTAVDTDS